MRAAEAQILDNGAVISGKSRKKRGGGGRGEEKGQKQGGTFTVVLSERAETQIRWRGIWKMFSTFKNKKKHFWGKEVMQPPSPLRSSQFPLGLTGMFDLRPSAESHAAVKRLWQISPSPDEGTRPPE